MTKYMVLYNSSASARDLMASATPEEVKASMDEWIQWKDSASAKAKIEFGMPLQADSSIRSSGVTALSSQVGGYSMIEADSKELVLELLKTHPHLKRPDASID